MFRMPKELKNGISAIITELKKENKNRLAGCISENWNKTCLQYSKELFEWEPEHPMEPEMKAAMESEISRVGLSEEAPKIVSFLSKHRVLQTAPHLVLTLNPRMLCIEWLGSLGVPDQGYYVSATFSGIPFSNSFRPGRVNRKTGSVNLLPSSMQDALVYRSRIPDKLPGMLSSLPEPIAKMLDAPHPGDSFTRWALKAGRKIEGKIFGRRNIILVDINEITAEYLKLVLGKKNHPVREVFFNPVVRREFVKIFPNEIMFYSPAKKGKYDSMENLRMKDLESDLDSSGPEGLKKKIEKENLCPGLLLVFIATAFLNGFKCYGSFSQVEYLPEYQKKLGKMEIFKPYGIEKVPTANLTTGVFPGTKEWPADIIIEGKEINPDPEMLFGELLAGMKDTLSAGRKNK